MPSLPAVALAALLISSTPQEASPPDAAPQASDPRLSFEKYQLPNGLTVILSEDHRLPQVAVNLWYKVGAASQSPGKSGFAHLFEHMMFSGAKHIGPQPFKVLEAIGTAGGSMANGSTSFDRTNYYEIVPSNELPTALWLESDRMGFLLETLDEKKLAIQRDVVSNERRQSYENRPYGTAFLRMCDLLYPAPHPYYNCVIGTVEDIQSASMDELKSFFRQFYAPNNASISLVGDFDPGTAKELIAKYFGPIPKGPPIQRPEVAQPMISGLVEETVLDKVAAVPKLLMAWNGIRPYTEEEAAGDVMAFILGSGKTSRLYRALVFDQRVASQVAAMNVPLDLGGFLAVDVVAQRGRTLPELRKAVDAVIAELRGKGVTAEEVQRAQRNMIAGKLRGLERVGGRADLLNHYQTALGDPGYLPRDIARYRAVTPEAVKAFAQKYLPPDRRIVMEVKPTSSTPANAAAPRSEKP